MKKITDFIVEKRNVILIIFIFITGLCLYLSQSVNINDDITKYLPSSSDTRVGLDIMENNFSEQKSSNLNIMFKDLSLDKKKEIFERLQKIDGVSKVDYDDTDQYNKDKYTLYTITVDDYKSSDTAKYVYDTVNDEFNFSALSGSINDEYKPVLQISVVLIAIGMAMIILIIMSESYVEPFLYLISIGIAVFINKGTNIMFDSVSNITDSITAILQLALSMDYSIMLSNRYRQEKLKECNNIRAMKNALYDSFKSISSSSITTIVGLLALVFMSFTIGRDLGFVLAKGVLLSLVSIFLCLPALLLMFDKLITKTHKKSPKFNLKKLGEFSYKTRYFQLIIIIVAFIGSYLLKGNLGILYTGSEQDEVGKIFPATNQIAIVYKNEYENIMSEYCKELENNSNIDQVLCYSNTINEKIAYDKLNDKFKDLGQEIDIDDYLIKLIYYNYYNSKNDNKLSLNEFVSFIKSDIYTNDKFSSSITSDVKNNLNKLEYFMTIDNVNKVRSSKEISDILGINVSDVNNLLIYYNSKNINNTMSLKTFVDFMYKDVLTDSTYSSSINESSKNSLNQLKIFTNSDIINKEMSSSEISKLFGIDENVVDQLFLFYRVNSDSNSKLTISQFANFTINYVAANDSYKSMFDSNTLELLNIVSKFSDISFINTKYNSSEMSNIFSSFGLTSDMINNLYLLYASNNDSNTKLTMYEFSKVAINVVNDDSVINNLNNIIKLVDNSNVNLDSNSLSMLFNIDSTITSAIVSNYGNNNLMTPIDFVSTLINSGIVTDSNSLNLLNKSYFIMSNKSVKYDYNEMSNLLNSSSDLIKKVYGIYDYNKDGLKLSVKELIDFIIVNKDNELLKDNLINYIDKLYLLNNIMSNSSSELSFIEISNVLNIDSSKVKMIYGLYDYVSLNNNLTPYNFVSLIINNKDNELLSGKMDNSSLAKLNLVYKIMSSTVNDIRYSASDLSNLLGIDKDTVKLLYSLYSSKYINGNNSISLSNFTNFIVKDVLNNSNFNKKFSDGDKSKIVVINSVISNTLKNYKYSTAELYSVLSKLSDGLDSNLVDLVYIYNGSVNNYDDKWSLTIEEFINYLNDDILNDERFKKFLTGDIENKIISGKDKINDAKSLLVSKNYSRVVLNTKYSSEGDDTLMFIQDTLDRFNGKDGIYVAGNSPMALEMSKSFNSELDFITILTMIFIFVVVAITFKSIIIPLILVLIIQCAVYVTMGFLSLFGGNVYFISLLIVQAILMGATIDYAIVYTSYYKEFREKMDIKSSIINAYNNSIHTILTSSSILIIVTLIVANFASAIAAKICETISQGTFCAVILILFILPGILSVFDRLICRKSYNKN